jgi:hypothetical protein
MRRRQFIALLGCAAAAWPLAAQPEEAARLQATTASLPNVEVLRVKRLDPAAPTIQFRLSDGVVDLMNGFSLAASEGIGGTWKTPRASDTFNMRYGQW